MTSIAFDATPLLGDRAGVGAFVEGALGALASADGAELSAYALTWRGRRQVRAQVPSGVRAIRRPLPARPLRLAWARADWPPAEWWTGRVDVVHGTNFVVPPTRHAAQVVTVHDLTSVRFPEMSTADTMAFPALVRRALKRGAWVHTPSRAVADDVVELLGADPARVVPVAHGLPALPEPPAGDARPPISGSYILALGTVEPRKDLPTLVAAFDAVAATRPEVRLVVAGPDGWGMEAFTAARSRARAASRIVRLGYVDAGRRTVLLRSATVFAFPSLHEGFGLPPLEAMASGVPVVASTAGALPEVLGDAAALVPPSDVDALAHALGRVLDDEGARSDLVARGRARAAGYRWEDTAAGLLDLYRRAASTA